jgi:hypothetical protein
MRIILVILAFCLTVLVSCSRRNYQLAPGWTPQVKITESKDGLVGGVELYKWHNAIMVLQGLDDGSARCFTMNRENNSWAEVKLVGVPHGYLWAYPAIDQASDKVYFEQGYMENDQLIMEALVGRMADGVVLQDGSERQWITDKKTLFRKAPPNIRLNDPGKRDWPSLGVGLINGSDFYIPYRLIGEAWLGNGISVDDSLFHNGVFHSFDSGRTWQIEKISDFEAWLPSICKTKDYYYYLAVKDHQRDLWFARKSVQKDSWSEPNVITTTFCNSALYWKYVSMADNDTIHVCWLDRRHEKTRFSLEDPSRNNFEVTYSHRKDAENAWSKDAILSKGLPYSYTPTMSVDGNKVIIVWAGSESDDRLTDIIYVTSKDGGKTWSNPLKVTDDAKNGITSGEPQVMLQNGVIHLFYIQGKRDRQQLSPGLTKLNQPPWPIYYTQRPFPD